MLMTSSNHGTLRLPNEDDNILYSVERSVYYGVSLLQFETPIYTNVLLTPVSVPHFALGLGRTRIEMITHGNANILTRRLCDWAIDVNDCEDYVEYNNRHRSRVGKGVGHLDHV